MAGMPGVPQPVDNPEVEIFEMQPALARDVVDIRRIGGVADPVTERWNIAMLQQEGRKRERSPLPFDAAVFPGFDLMMIQDRRIVAARRRGETVGKPRQDIARG